MASSGNYYNFYPSEMCVPVTVDLVQEDFSVDSAWMAGAFFLGLFLGALFTAICVPFCLKDLEKKKRQEDEEAMLKEAETTQTTAYLVKKKSPGDKTDRSQTGKSGRGGKKVTKREIEGESGEEDESRPLLVTPALSGTDGLGKIMTNFHSEDAENEMMKQDLKRVESLALALQLAKDQVLYNMVKKQLKKLKVGEQARSIIERNLKEDLSNRRKILEDERKEEEQIIRQCHVKDKDTSVMEDELERLDAKTNQKLARIHEEEGDFIKKEISKQSELTDKEIDALMEKLLSEMSEVDRKQALQLLRQQRALEERLAKRRQIIAMRKLQDQQETDVVIQNVESHEDALKQLVQDGKLQEKKKNQILNEYMQDLNRLTKARDLECQRQQLALEEKLAKRRRRELQKLSQEQEKEEQFFLQNTEKSTDTKGLADNYLELKEKHQLEMDQKELQLDQDELQALDKIRMEAMEVKEKEIENHNEKVVTTITEVVGVDHKFDVDRLIKAHKKRMQQYEEDRLEERNKFAARLKERLNDRMAKLEEEEEAQQQEQDALVVQQTATVNKVLTSSMELAEEAKEKILREHEHNLQVINNQLQVSRLKQQKSLENKLAEKRARMAEIRRKKEETLMNKAKANLVERGKYQQELDAELQLEEKRLEDERRAALAALRRRMAAETQEALKEQEKRLGLLIGRLEVGTARRQAILSKQDATLQNLQEQLENKLTREGSRLTGVDVIIQQHSSQVDQLNDQLQRAREHQENLIKEKIMAKKHQKEMELREQIQDDREINKNSSIRRRGAGKASNILNTAFMEQRHKKQREELESEMKLELEKSKEELNQQLENELQTELENQRRELLTQLTAASGMSRSEVESTIKSAVQDTGGNDKAAKKLAKELRHGMERAKTDMNYGMDEDYLASRDVYGIDDLQPVQGRPASSGGKVKKGKKKKQGRSAVVPEPTEGWTHYDDDDDLL
ncbi:trichohyalin-like [Ostrea edulis]|uniref:trichohyalin-like n=1 Tax=Ostrea edulis TaxID=37623 RepID=UPI0024AFEBDC|nr:trichohyalin-like [Ostrea edulis]XP_056006530.1 trichohyalin-like [Ostrea edulis]XP_056006531.1 trichohyalin-like [Ostrea edulis]XP_056006532.1 trichohyalin-like [Ostrea edulis]